ncbi:SusC/RagA family TonB-linked outer membrane protein [Pseudoflavitalea sp. G-6-1-2]|uniref:SusC/RagA family TonB-linked outer membrane protein n=1 Tax=Pseudoflavitalea sp. G-6-1-2 TaxID=2728841 RepID=UPI00146BE9CC|nr:SusC/RagA family TonB-linked outer membrane protein [Pseudoflavitalea sp. G-6-1-2]NML22242.1 SusC/RagA family TonB-linked outer membrane protein [Pseudoflavitalea sp. G-6-1-2]
MRSLLMSLCILLCATLAYAQNRTIKGRVTDESNNPLPNASVQIKGSKKGTTADGQGNFTITASTGDVLVINVVGYAKQEITLGEQTDVSVSLKRTDESMQEVIVTAMGIRRSKNTLPYAAQQVSGAEVAQSRGNNFASALSGRVSGVEIRQGNAMGASTNVIVRGTKSLLNNNQALFVIDGVPVDNSNNNGSNKGRTTSDDQANGRGGYDYGNAAADINPDDIETYTVLKGAASTALYGSRAANGVVLITTKKAKKGLGLVVNSGVSFGKIDKNTYAKYQREYGAGYQQGGYSKTADGSPNTQFWWRDPFGTGTKALIVPTTEDASYGARFDPNLKVYDWTSFDSTSANYKQARPWVAGANDPTTFFETGISTNNSVFLDGGSDKMLFKVGYTRNDEKGVLPNSRLLKNLINLGASYKPTDKVTVTANLNISKIDGKGRYGTGYSKYNINQSFRQWWQTNVDVKELKDAYYRTGRNITWNWADPTKADGLYPIYTDNPYFIRNENYQTDTRLRYFGTASLSYDVTDWLNLLGRVSLDSYSELEEERIAVGSVSVSSYSRFERTFKEYNYDLMANLNKDLTDNINLRAVIGTNLRRNNVQSSYAITNGGLVEDKGYFLLNSLYPIAYPVEQSQKQAVDGYFANATLTYKEFLTLDGSFRRDRSSTLAAKKNAYNYGSVSSSFVFSHFINAPWLSLGKLRLNYAEVGNSAPVGATNNSYDRNTNFQNAVMFSLPDNKANENLEPERTKSKEIGVEMSFLKNRVGFDVTYYHTRSVNQISLVTTSASTGYTAKYVNAGVIVNKGWELSMFGSPIKTKDFSWNINLNWTRNRNLVESLNEGASNLQIGSFQGGVTVNATVGQPYGTIQGKTWERHANGEKLVGSNGYYVQTTTTNNVIGNVNPDWTGGMYNTFRYKNFSLGFLIDIRKGGDVFSLDMYYGLATGVLAETVGDNDLGKPKRAPLSEGGGLIVPGVTADGKPNTKRVENIKSGYYGYTYNPAANFVYDASYVKLREMNITYSLPNSIIEKTKVFKAIDVSLIGRNLWIIHKNLPYADPEENLTAGNAQGIQSGAYPTTRTIGVNLKLKF